MYIHEFWRLKGAVKVERWRGETVGLKAFTPFHGQYGTNEIVIDGSDPWTRSFSSSLSSLFAEVTADHTLKHNTNSIILLLLYELRLWTLKSPRRWVDNSVTLQATVLLRGHEFPQKGHRRCLPTLYSLSLSLLSSLPTSLFFFSSTSSISHFIVDFSCWATSLFNASSKALSYSLFSLFVDKSRFPHVLLYLNVSSPTLLSFFAFISLSSLLIPL